MAIYITSHDLPSDKELNDFTVRRVLELGGLGHIGTPESCPKAAVPTEVRWRSWLSPNGIGIVLYNLMCFYYSTSCAAGVDRICCSGGRRAVVPKF